MGYGLHYKIQDQYSHDWVERLTESLKDHPSISISHAVSEIDLEKDIYNVGIHVHYRDATVIFFGDGPVNGTFSVLIFPKSKNRTDLKALFDIIEEKLKPILQDEPPTPPLTYWQILVECFLLIICSPLFLLIGIACLVSIGIRRVRQLFGGRKP